jgi:hypothetical protein
LRKAEKVFNLAEIAEIAKSRMMKFATSMVLAPNLFHGLVDGLHSIELEEVRNCEN